MEIKCYKSTFKTSIRIKVEGSPISNKMDYNVTGLHSQEKYKKNMKKFNTMETKD